MTNTATSTGRPGTKRFWGGLVLLGIGLILGAFIIANVASLFRGILTNPEHPIPGEFTQELDEGTQIVTVKTQTGSGAGGFSVTRRVDIQVTGVEVFGPDGTQITTRSGRSETLTRNNDQFAGFARFDVVDPGVHRVVVTGAGTSTAVVTPSLTGVAWSVFALAPIAGLSFLVGLVLTIVGFVKRREDPNAVRPSPPAGPPPGPAAPGPPPAPAAPGWSPQAAPPSPGWTAPEPPAPPAWPPASPPNGP